MTHRVKFPPLHNILEMTSYTNGEERGFQGLEVGVGKDVTVIVYNLGNENLNCLDCIHHVNILVVMLYDSLSKFYLGGSWLKRTLASVLFFLQLYVNLQLSQDKM